VISRLVLDLARKLKLNVVYGRKVGRIEGFVNQYIGIKCLVNEASFFKI
jgi:hypothetical protein